MLDTQPGSATSGGPSPVVATVRVRPPGAATCRSRTSDSDAVATAGAAGAERSWRRIRSRRSWMDAAGSSPSSSASRFSYSS